MLEQWRRTGSVHCTRHFRRTLHRSTSFTADILLFADHWADKRLIVRSMSVGKTFGDMLRGKASFDADYSWMGWRFVAL